MDFFPHEFLLFLCSYMICGLSKNKIVNFIFGSIMGFIVLSALFPPSSLDLDPTGFIAFGVLGLIFFTGYSISKATT